MTTKERKKKKWWLRLRNQDQMVRKGKMASFNLNLIRLLASEETNFAVETDS